MSGTQIKDFTSGNITKQLALFAWPLVVSNILQIAYNMVDMVIVGHVLGQTGLSSVSVGGDIVTFLTFVAMGFSSAGQVLIAKYVGSKRTDLIGRFVGTMVGFTLASSIVLTIVALFFQGNILALMNTPPEAYEGADLYSFVCISGLVFIYGYNVLCAVLRGMGDSKHPLAFIGFAMILNVILDLLFVVCLGMGTGGAALATVASQACSFFACALFLSRNREAFCLNTQLKDFIHWDTGMLEALVKLGVPMSIKTASIQFSKLFVNSWINSYGVVVSAFAGIGNKIDGISNLLVSAMTVAGSTMVGQNIAGGKDRRVFGIMLRIAVITLSIAIVASTLFMLFPSVIFGFFTSDEAVLSLSPQYAPIAALLFFGGALRAPMGALINGSGNNKINFVTAILDGIVMRIGLALLFGIVLDMQYFGFWLGNALAGFTPFPIGLAFYLSGRWKNKVKSSDRVSGD